MFVIGLTGGIGTGKSTVSQMLQELGAGVIDADQVGHQAYRPGTPAWRDIVAQWGPDVMLPSGEVNRKRLGEIVFRDRQALQRLNDIVHPRMRSMLEEMLEQRRREGSRVVVLEAAILLEAKWAPLVDEVWVTVAPEETVIRRLQGRNGWTAEQVRARIRSQLSNEERVARADVAIDTDCTIPEVREKVRHLWAERVAKKKDPAGGA